MPISRLIYLGCLAFIVLLTSCGTNHDHVVKKERIFPGYTEVLDDIIKKPEGVIRGIDLNSKADAIKKAETVIPSEVDTGYLYFEYVIDSTTHYSVAYSLEKDSLNEIEVQVNCKDLDMSTKVFNDLKSYYEKKLPNPTEDKGYVVYNCFEGQRKPFVVSLTDNSTPTEGIISLIIYKDK